MRIHASSGTTGKPTVVGYTKQDLDTWSELVARLGDGGRSRVSVPSFRSPLATGLFTGALGLHYGLEKVRRHRCALFASGNTEKQLMLMRDFGTTTLGCHPLLRPVYGRDGQGAGYPMSDYQAAASACSVPRAARPKCGQQIEKNLGIVRHR